MTTESNHNDPRVSEAYQGLATETTPPGLDRRILAMAADKRRSRYGLARVWVRPLAWAATIGLSLAIVLEVSQFRYGTTPPIEADDVETLEEVLVPDEASARDDDDIRLQRGSAKRANEPVPLQLSAPAARQASSPPAAAKTAPARDVELTPDSVSVYEDFATDDMSLLREAEEQARLRSGAEPAAAEAANAIAFDATTRLEKKEQDPYCDPDMRSSAEAWYICIEDLRAQGRDDDANSEFLLLLAEFPDFEEQK